MPHGAVFSILQKSPKNGTWNAPVYFDNDRKVRAPFDAVRLAERVLPKRQRKSA